MREITKRLFHGSYGSAFLLEDEAQLGPKLSSLVVPDVSLLSPAPEVGFVHRKLTDGEIYFLANTGNTRQTATATFRVTGLQPEWWDPITGYVSAAAVKKRTSSGTTIELELEPYASKILVFSARKLLLNIRPVLAVDSMDISGDWRVTFGDGRRVAMDQLRSWTYFSGRVIYEKTITIPKTMLPAGTSVQLDFGQGKPIPSQKLKAGMQAWLDAPIREAAVVYVNGERSGSLWCPPYSIEVTKFLHIGENVLKVEVANLAINYMAGRSLPDYRLLSLRYGTRFEAQDMDKVQLIPAGLFGHIHLITFRPVSSSGSLRRKKVSAPAFAGL